jgi:hypothetical protein
MNLIIRSNKALFYTFLLGFAWLLMLSLASCQEAEKSNLIKQKSLTENKDNKAKKSCCMNGKPDRFTKN